MNEAMSNNVKDMSNKTVIKLTSKPFDIIVAKLTIEQTPSSGQDEGKQPQYRILHRDGRE